MDYETIVIPQKPESVTSTTSSTDQIPPLYSGSSVCDADSPMMQEPGPYEGNKNRIINWYNIYIYIYILLVSYTMCIRINDSFYLATPVCLHI